jgi:hypothetical protein
MHGEDLIDRLIGEWQAALDLVMILTADGVAVHTYRLRVFADFPIFTTSVSSPGMHHIHCVYAA